MGYCQAVELLSPAGGPESLKAAADFGADAVYIGAKRFGMRSAPENFDPDSLAQGVAYCHRMGKRVYLTCNTLPREEELSGLEGFVREAAAAGVDALIVADLGVMRLAKRLEPDLALHVSTQFGVVNSLSATELYHMGAATVVLARELSVDEIARIRENTPPALRLEAFVHGAMCMSFSGRCVISNYLTGRDANRGQCAQPCRWRYALVEEKRPGEFFPVVEEDEGSFLLNAKDLCMIGHLDKLVRAGVGSLKIEGRAKSAYYTAAVTAAYRQALDLCLAGPEDFRLPDWLWQEVGKISHRPYTTGFYLPEDPPDQSLDKSYQRDWQLVATVDGYRDGRLLVTERNRFRVGEALEVLSPGRRPEPLVPEALFDEEGEAIAVARHPMMRVQIPCGVAYPAGSMIRRRAEETYLFARPSPNNRKPAKPGAAPHGQLRALCLYVIPCRPLPGRPGLPGAAGCSPAAAPCSPPGGRWR